MKEIPMRLIKSNQVGIVLFVVLAILLQQPLFIYALLIIQLVPLLFTSKYNLFIWVGRLIFKKSLPGKETQAVELARFNQTIAVLLLAASSLFFILGWYLAAYIAAGFVAIAATVAILGYCIGCTLYFQYKQRIARHSKME